MTHRFLPLALSTLVSLVTLAACTEENPELPPDVQAPRNKVSGQIATPAPTPAASTAPGISRSGVNGGIDTGAAGVPVVTTLTVQPETLTLYLPPADPAHPAPFNTRQQLSATVTLSDGKTDPRGVNWTAIQPTRLSVDASGLVAVMAGAATGSTVVTATAGGDPSIKQNVIVTIADDGLLRVHLETATSSNPVLPAPSSDVTCVITRNGQFVQQQNLPLAGLQSEFTLALPAGSGYRAQFRTGAFPVTTNLGPFTILPGSVFEATASLVPAT